MNCPIQPVKRGFLLLEMILALAVFGIAATNSSVGETGIELDTTVEILDKLENEEGQFLQEMYLIKVEAKWFADGGWQQRAVETWRYGRLYQP